jgi:tRNA pseudouridine(55) synthase
MEIVYKQIGITCGEVVEKYRQEHKCDRIAFSGRLDPMAQGHLLIVYNDEVSNIEKYHKLDKIYQFKFVIGLATDSTDVLGLFINESYNDFIDVEKLKEKILSYRKTIIQQKYHKFSSFIPSKNKFDGKRKPLWWWSTVKPSENIDIPSKPINIYDIEINNIENKKYDELLKELIHNINIINKDNNFRQKEIIEQWENFKNIYKENLQFTCTIKVSSGFYVRQFVQDLSDYFNVKMMVTDINRIKIV